MSLSRCPFLLASSSETLLTAARINTPRSCPFISRASALKRPQSGVTLKTRSYATSSAETPNTTPSSSSPKDSGNSLLLKRAGLGFVAGLSIVLFLRSRETVKADSEPILPERKRGVTQAEYISRSSDEEETFRRSSSVGLSNKDGTTKNDRTVVINDEDDINNPIRIRMAQWVLKLQDHIVNNLEEIEASVPANEFSPSPTAPLFLRDAWLRPNNGGEGSSCTLSNGRVFEKAGVNISVIHGTLSPPAIKQMKANHKTLPSEGTEPLPYFVAGISIVLHPWNPHAPTVHMNYRYFEVDPPASSDRSALKAGEIPEPVAWWFGGGCDLTPSYLYPEDAKHFHKTMKAAADKHDNRYYPEWKKWCDKYFWIGHRGEARGVGGIFFDDLTSESTIHSPSESGSSSTSILSSSGKQFTKPPTPQELFEVIQTLSSNFLPSYLPVLKRRMHSPYTEEERRWQLMRRGRYVEFNLVHDRGTKFGLMTPGARIESILMSLPQTARWEYMSEMGAPGSGSREEKLLEVLRKPIDWA